MKIDHVKINRFRSIREASLTLNTITAVVGPNNSGKSAVLRAFNAFFHPNEEAVSFKDKSHAYSKLSKARIEISFSDLPKRKAIKKHSQNGVLIVRATWMPNSRSGHPIYEVFKNGKYLSADNNILRVIKEYVDYTLIPPHRDPSRFREEEQALLWKVVDRFLDKATYKRDTISSRFREAATYLESHQFDQISKALSDVYASPDPIKFRITLGDNISYRTFVRSVEVKVSERNATFSLDNCGTGVQSLAIVALHRLLGRFEERNILIGIEEPETNLHPQAQQRFIIDLQDSIDSDSQESQCILTTHSTVVVDALSHEDIVLVRKMGEASRDCGFRSSVTQLARGFWARHKLDELRYQKYHQYRNSDFFFARLVLVVEGTTEADVFRRMFRREEIGIDLDREGIAILTLDGEKNLAYARHLLAELQLPHIIVLDKDHFVPYLNDHRKHSTDSKGFPRYRDEFKDDALVDELVSDAQDRQTILKHISTHHTKVLNVLEKYNVVCMRWALEVDLVYSERGRNEMYKFLGIRGAEQSEHELLVKRQKRIKKPDLLVHVIDNLLLTSLPRSFSRVRKLVDRQMNGAHD